MYISRFAMLGLVCLFASACTVVLQPAADQPQRAPSATEPEADVGVADPQPVRRPPVQEPRRRPTDPDPDPGFYEPESPSRRPSARENRVNLGIPPGHLPGPGECRVWVQGTPPGRQDRARSCHDILATAPVGSWILYRPAQYPRQVRVRYLHATQQMIVAVRAFDAETGAYLRDFALEEDDSNMGPVATRGSRPTVRPSDHPTGSRGNSGVAVGRVDTTRDQSSTEGNRGNQGVENRSGNAAVKSSNQGRDNSITAADSTGLGGAVTGGGGTATEESRGGDSKVLADRRREPEDTSLDSEVQSPLGINARYFPSAGQCRIWVPGRPFGRQARPTSCDGIADEAPAGAWILRRSTAQPEVILVDYMDEETAGVVVRTSAFDAATGAALRSARLEPR